MRTVLSQFTFIPSPPLRIVVQPVIGFVLVSVSAPGFVTRLADSADAANGNSS